MVIMNDLEWPMLSYYVILYEKFRNVMQKTEKVALISFEVEYHANAKYENQYQNSEKIACIGQRLMYPIMEQ